MRMERRGFLQRIFAAAATTPLVAEAPAATTMVVPVTAAIAPIVDVPEREPAYIMRFTETTAVGACCTMVSSVRMNYRG